MKERRSLKQKIALGFASVGVGFSIAGLGLAAAGILESAGADETTSTQQTQFFKSEKQEAMLIGAYAAFGMGALCFAFVGGMEAIPYLLKEDDVPTETQKSEHNENFVNNSIDKMLDDGRKK